MSKDLKSKITKIILRKVAIRGAIALATAGTGLLLVEGIELAIDGLAIAEIAGEALEAADITSTGIEVSEASQMATEMMEVAEVTDNGLEVPKTPKALEFFKLVTLFTSISVSVFKIEIYFDKKNISLKEEAKKIIQENKKEEIQEINEIERKIQKTSSQAAKDSLVKKLVEKTGDLRKEIAKDKKVSKAILASVFATYVSIQGQAVGDFIGKIEEKDPSIISKLDSNPELVTKYLSDDKHYKKFAQDLENRLFQATNQGIEEAIIERLKYFPVKITCSEMDITFDCEGKSNNQVIVKAFKIKGEEILHLEGLNSEETRNPEIVINLENYPRSLLSDIFHMCRCYREYKRLDDTDYGKRYNQFRQKTLDGWHSLKNA